MSLEVVENGTIRELGYGFLFTFHINWPFRRYSVSKNGLTLKSGFVVVQGH